MGDLERSGLLAVIFKAADRCLWILEAYLEALALSTAINHLPAWPAAIVS